MAEWDRDRERYEPERDFRRDYLRPGLGTGTADPRRANEWARGVWTIGGEPRRGAGTIGPYAGKGPKGYRRSDARIHEDVCERLTRDAEIDATDIEVTVADGEVTLAGSVEDRRMRWMAEDVAAACPGVREVVNDLRIAGGPGERRPLSPGPTASGAHPRGPEPAPASPSSTPPRAGRTSRRPRGRR